MNEYFSEIDAIACGVEAKLDLLIGYSKVVAQRTIDVARQLDIPEKQLQRWVNRRAILDSHKSEVIKASLKKLERSLLAQHNGLPELYLHTSNLNKSQN